MNVCSSVAPQISHLNIHALFIHPLFSRVPRLVFIFLLKGMAKQLRSGHLIECHSRKSDVEGPVSNSEIVVAVLGGSRALHSGDERRPQRRWVQGLSPCPTPARTSGGTRLGCQELLSFMATSFVRKLLCVFGRHCLQHVPLVWLLLGPLIVCM